MGSEQGSAGDKRSIESDQRPKASNQRPTESSRPAVELLDVSKRYATTTAVDGVSLTVREGEFFTFVGPSGCGKTTTLRLIGGFESPDSGQLRLSGESVTGVAPEDRGLGVVFQSYALFPHMTVGENIAYGLNFADPPGGQTSEERVTELLERVDLAGMASRDPETLSGGQQQRVAMARALAPGPDVLLLDEPMSALDAQLRQRLRLQIREIQQELGLTTIYVTHDQEEALALSDRVAVMSDGQVQQIGTPEAVYHRPENRFVADFIGDNNVLSGQAVEAVDAETAHPDNRRVDVAVGDTTVTVELDADSAPCVDVGDSLTFCVRPEQFSIGEGTNQLTVRVDSAEFLGSTTRVHCTWQGHELLIRTATPLSGTLTVGFEPADVHVVSVDQ